MKIPTKNRKAISPVLATVILIAITLIAAVAIAGFVFGLFGSFTSSAQVSAQVISCSHNAGNDTCYVQLTNTGTSNSAATGCSLRISGTATVGTLGATKSVPASGGNPLRCSVALGAAQTSGSQVVGSFAMSNGASVPFTGVWQ
jgi:flagellin-like protein